MKLTELNPRWVERNAAGIPIGITFLCPHCHTQRLGVFWEKYAFHDLNGNGVVDEGEMITVADKEYVKTGNDFETLSLNPSIDASLSGHWHGYITNGEVI